MLNGINHVAMITRDADRLIEFYRSVFGAEVTVEMKEEVGRHFFIDIGAGGTLHYFEMPGNPHAAGSPDMFGRGHVDHLALNVSDEETFQRYRKNLVDAGASDGLVTDFGMVKTCFFRDPDGFDCEIALWKDEEIRTFEDRVLESYDPGDV